ncbi:MAG: acetyltransferase [Magnetococcus sp. DMHC-8]
MARQWILLGCGGHGRVLLATLQALGWMDRLVGILDQDPQAPDRLGWPIPLLGDDGYLSTLHTREIRLLNGLGSVASTTRRREVYQKWQAQGYTFASVRHPTAWLADSVHPGEGVQVMAGAVIQTGCQLGENVLVNTRAVLDHDCLLHDHVHVASGAVLCGQVQVGAGAHVGAGATVIQGIQIGANACVGAGAVVVRDVPNGVKVVGVPAREC